MRRLRRLLLFVGIVCGVCFIIFHVVLAPQIDKIFDCIGHYPTSITHLAWSEDSQHILIRLETPVEFYGAIAKIIVVPVSSDEDTRIVSIASSQYGQFNAELQSDERSMDGTIPASILTSDEQWLAYLRINRNGLDVYIQNQNSENQRLLYRFQPEDECFTWRLE